MKNKKYCKHLWIPTYPGIYICKKCLKQKIYHNDKIRYSEPDNDTVMVLQGYIRGK